MDSFSMSSYNTRPDTELLSGFPVVLTTFFTSAPPKVKDCCRSCWISFRDRDRPVPSYLQETYHAITLSYIIKAVTNACYRMWHLPPPWAWHKGHNFLMEHVTANSRLHAQQNIRSSIVVKFHQIFTLGVGRVKFTKISNGQTAAPLIPVTISWRRHQKTLC